MAQPPANPPSQTTALSQYTPGGGFSQPTNVTEYQMAPYPIPNPPILLGVDFVAFNTANNQYATFLNLPIRGTSNPLSTGRSQPQTISILPQDTLLYEVIVQSTNQIVQIQAQVLDENNNVYIGPFLGAGSYLTFRAMVSSTEPASGTLVGKIYIQRG